MKLIDIKQYIKVKVHTKDTEEAIIKALQKVLGESIDYIIIDTYDIPCVAAGSKVIVATNKEKNRYFAVTLGASTKVITGTTDKLEEVTCSFEYVLEIDKKLFKGIEVSDIINHLDNKDIAEALTIIGVLADNCRYNTALFRDYCRIGDDKSRFKGIVFDEFREDSDEFKYGGDEVKANVKSKCGDIYFLKAIPLLEDEISVLEYFETPSITEMISAGHIINSNDKYTNRKKKFNFFKIFVDKNINPEILSNAGVRLDKQGKPVLYTADEINDYLAFINNITE